MQVHDPFGQGSGFIRTEQIHSPQIFNREQFLDDHL